MSYLWRRSKAPLELLNRTKFVRCPRTALRPTHALGGHSPQAPCPDAAVKMQSNGRGTSWGSVKRSRSVLGHYPRCCWRSRGVADPFAHAQLIDGHVKGQVQKIIQRGQDQTVEAIFLTVKNLDPKRIISRGCRISWRGVLLQYYARSTRGIFRSHTHFGLNHAHSPPIVLGGCALYPPPHP